MPKLVFSEVVGAIMGLIALVAVSYASIIQTNGEAMIALVAVLSAAAGFFLRGKVERQAPPPSE